MPKQEFIDLTGDRYGRLLVVEFIGFSSHGKSVWLCECDCGKTHEVLSGSLRSGRTKSCGCLRVEVSCQQLEERFDLKRRFIAFGGKEQDLASWARDLGISSQVLQWRLQRWSKERALTEAKHNCGPK